MTEEHRTKGFYAKVEDMQLTQTRGQYWGAVGCDAV